MTLAKEIVIREAFSLYCNRLCIAVEDTPTLVIGIKAYKEYCDSHPGTSFHKDIRGYCYPRANVIFVMPENHTAIRALKSKMPGITQDIRNTVAHELLHIKNPKLKHGKRFEKYVRQIMRGKIRFL